MLNLNQVKSPEEQSAENVAQLQLMAVDLRSNTDVQRGLERLLSSTLGAPARHLSSETVMPPRTRLAYIRTRRTHTKHVFQIAGEIPPKWSGMVRDDTIAVFVKAGLKFVSSPLDTVLNGATTKGFRPPHFFGVFQIDGLFVGAWEFVEGKRMPFNELPLPSQVCLVRAIADINVIAAPEVPTKTKWVIEPFKWYEQRFRKFSVIDQAKWQGALVRVEKLLARGDIVKELIGGYGERLLTHNDINPNNVFTPTDGEIVVFDWEGVTLSVPGADLRFLVQMEAKDVLLESYLEQMAEHGLRFERGDVLRALEIIEGFRLIYQGWANHNLSAVQRGLTMVEAYIAAPKTLLECNAAITNKIDSGIDSENEDEMKKITKVDSAAVSATAPEAPPLQQQMKEPSPELVKKINEYIAERGKIYAPIDHPTFASLPCSWKPNRFELFRPHLEYEGGTALDIGSHWGYMAHRLEKIGYKVTANEYSLKHLYFLKELRDLAGLQFEIISTNIFDMKEPNFDVILALNIFHHFLKSDDRLENFKKFLSRTKCRMMIYQSHRPTERPKLDVANHYMEPREMAEFIAERLSLSSVTHIGVEGGRDVFKLAK